MSETPTLCSNCKCKLDESDSSMSKASSSKNVGVGTAKAEVSAEDLICTHECCTEYWRSLAEAHAKSLNESFEKNYQLESLAESLQRENNIQKKELEDTIKVVKVLKGILKEKDKEVPPQGSD